MKFPEQPAGEETIPKDSALKYYNISSFDEFNTTNPDGAIDFNILAPLIEKIDEMERALIAVKIVCEMTPEHEEEKHYTMEEAIANMHPEYKEKMEEFGVESVKKAANLYLDILAPLSEKEKIEHRRKIHHNLASILFSTKGLRTYYKPKKVP